MDGHRILRYPPDNPRRALENRRRIINEVSDRGVFGREGTSIDRILTPYFGLDDDRMASDDPASVGGVKIAYSELDADLQAQVSSGGGVLKEVKLVFPTAVPSGVVFNIQTGVYLGGVAVVAGDTSIILPASGAVFVGEGRISVILNGQSLVRGAMAGAGEVYWMSSVQLALNAPLFIFSGNEVVVKAP
jgi:hypothetical protein